MTVDSRFPPGYKTNQTWKLIVMEPKKPQKNFTSTLKYDCDKATKQTKLEVDCDGA